METINLSKLPNQMFFVITNNVKVDFRLHLFRDVLYCDLWVGERKIANSVRCVPNGWLLPARYNTSIGNFRFETANGEYPNADDFGDSCILTHYEPDEIE